MPQRPVVVVIYGTPGTGKTSLACTSENPLLIDTDRGFDRACERVDTITATKWDDFYNSEVLGDDTMAGLVSGYKTIIIDTAKACIDDYLSAFVVSKNYKLATNSLKRFGEIGDQFRNFVNQLRAKGNDIVFVCHDKEVLDGDIIRHSPDCTGQSKDLLVRIADEVGYVCKVNGKRTIVFEPSDTRVGKNAGGLPDMQIPDCGSADFGGFFARVIAQVKCAIQSKGEAQRTALEAIKEARERLEGCDTAEAANELAETAKTLAPVYRKAFCEEMVAALAEKDIILKNKKFVKDEQAAN